MSKKNFECSRNDMYGSFGACLLMKNFFVSAILPSSSKNSCFYFRVSSYSSSWMFSESSLWLRIAPSGVRATTSVKVPPRSIQKSHWASLRMARFARLHRRRRFPRSRETLRGAEPWVRHQPRSATSLPVLLCAEPGRRD